MDARRAAQVGQRRAGIAMRLQHAPMIFLHQLRTPYHASRPAMVEEDRPRAEGLDGGHIVAHEKDRGARSPHLAHAAHTLALESQVADGQHLIDDQNLRLQMRATAKARRTYMPLE